MRSRSVISTDVGTSISLIQWVESNRVISAATLVIAPGLVVRTWLNNHWGTPNTVSAAEGAGGSAARLGGGLNASTSAANMPVASRSWLRASDPRRGCAQHQPVDELRVPLPNQLGDQ